jgi:sialic acid synthase SpsE
VNVFNNVPLVLSHPACKSLVATQPIKTGELFSADNITAKRPGAGISPMRWDEVLGQVAQKDYEKDELI